MPDEYGSFAALHELGFDIAFRSFSDALFGYAFRDAAHELVTVLQDISIPVSDLVAGGGGEATSTQRLRRALSELGWEKHEFEVSKRIDGIETISESHEVDHVKRFPNGTVALEIEWNNKDPFFDRDLENFARLHADNAIALGVIVTRGASLQGNLERLVHDYARRQGISSIESLERHLRDLDRTLPPRQRRNLEKTLENTPRSFEQVWANLFVKDKFGQATTHWVKLEARLRRGLGSPCPFLGVGIPSSIVKQD